jgi:hypothetical protein
VKGWQKYNFQREKTEEKKINLEKKNNIHNLFVSLSLLDFGRRKAQKTHQNQPFSTSHLSNSDQKHH